MTRIRGSARSDILAATRRLLETAPFDEVTLGRVAQEAKASRQSVYRLFGSRHGLLLALVASLDPAAGAGTPLGPGVPSMPPSDDPETLFRAIVGQALAYNGRIAAVGLALRDARRRNSDAAAAWDDRMAARSAMVAQLLAPLAAAGRLRPGLSVAVAADLVASLASLSLYEELVQQRGWPEERYVAEVTSLIVGTVLG
jgi:AcrR family transcriptional regulator